MSANVKVYQDAANEWRWTLVDGNNRIIADGSQGYDSEAGCRKGFKNAVQEMAMILARSLNEGSSIFDRG